MIVHTPMAHEGMDNYKCELCDQNFTQHENLKSHINIVHGLLEPQMLKSFLDKKDVS